MNVINRLLIFRANKCVQYIFVKILQSYRLAISRKPIPRYIKITDPELAIQYEDPVSLSALYRPISIKDSDPKHSFSAPIIDEFTKASKVDPLNQMPLVLDWRVIEYELDAKISQTNGCIPLTNGGE